MNGKELLEIRECKHAAERFLRVQVGYTTRRVGLVPVYEKKGKNAKLVGHKKNGSAQTFVLLGWGETFARAMAVAEKKIRMKGLICVN